MLAASATVTLVVDKVNYQLNWAFVKKLAGFATATNA